MKILYIRKYYNTNNIAITHESKCENKPSFPWLCFVTPRTPGSLQCHGTAVRRCSTSHSRQLTVPWYSGATMQHLSLLAAYSAMEQRRDDAAPLTPGSLQCHGTAARRCSTSHSRQLTVLWYSGATMCRATNDTPGRWYH